MFRFALLLACLFVATSSALPAGKHDSKDEVAGATSSPSPVSPAKPVEENAKQPPKTTITFDQRQEGKFNVRADLENFVIVFVPSSPSQGMSLLEMLASMRRTQSKNGNKRISSEKDVKGKYSKKVETNPKETPVVDSFIEGRTPYKVDISSTLTDANLQETSSVEGNNNNRKVIVVESRQKRVPKHLGLYNNVLKSNSVVALINPSSTSSYDGEGLDELYRDTDFAPRHAAASISSSAYLKELTDSIPSIDSLKLESADNDWKLLGATEPGCGPDRNMRRDSYGICRFYPIDV
ncbi:uncharacterized protein LOC134831716 isoform X2 [Culicoides brevitarsis]|uniref:uncharacterized protein LOC134831716 isoform X2 n=1 Tax=Culicoides brevitarsis TaxID=469753 RepID=UPI00307B4F78